MGSWPYNLFTLTKFVGVTNDRSHTQLKSSRGHTVPDVVASYADIL